MSNSLEEKYTKKKTDLTTYYDGQKDLLKQNYDISVSELDAQKKQASEHAAISHELLKKYLPTTMRATGVANTGMADSLSLQALTNYQNNLADIAIGYNSDKSSLDKAYNSDVSDLETRRRAEENTLLSEYEAKAEAEKIRAEEKAAADSTVAFEEVAQYIDEAMIEAIGEDGKISQADYDKLKIYIDSTPNLIDADKAALNNKLKQYEGKVRSVADQTALDADTARNATLNQNKNVVSLANKTDVNLTDGENFKVKLSVSDTTYNVQIGSVATVAEAAELNSLFENKTPSDGSSVVDGEKIYMYLKGKGGTCRWVKLEKRAWAGKDNGYTKLLADLKPSEE